MSSIKNDDEFYTKIKLNKNITMENIDTNTRKLDKKRLKIYSNPSFIIEDIDTGAKQTFKNKKEFDESLTQVYIGCFNCEIDSSEFNAQVNS